MNTTYSASIVDAGIDYLTITEPAASAAGTLLWEQGATFLQETAAFGAGLRDMSPQGFTGAGNEFGFLGMRDGRVMARFAGKAAGDFHERIKPFGHEWHATRIDFQVTAEYDQYPERLAAELLARVRAAETRNGYAVRKTAVHYQAPNIDTGISIGARTAKSFVRCYHPASRGHTAYSANAFRFEIEYKQDRAATGVNMAGKAEAAHYLAAGMVQGELLKHGIQEPWFKPQSFAPIKSSYKSSDQAKRMAWLETTVAPVITKLLEDSEYRLRVVDLLSRLKEGSNETPVSTALKPWREVKAIRETWE